MSQLATHKGNVSDGLMVLAGTSYAVFAEALPIIIGALTAALFIYRIFIARQETKINDLQIEKLKRELEKL